MVKLSSIKNKKIEINIMHFFAFILIIIFVKMVMEQRPANIIILNKDNKKEEGELVEKSERKLRFPYNYYNTLVRKPYNRLFSREHEPPLRDYTPVNMPTRGEPTSYQQIGILTPSIGAVSTPIPGSSISPKILPLYGRQTYSGSNKWHYYISSDGYHSVKLPISKGEKDCMDDWGCSEIYDGDVIFVPIYNQNFKATIYNYRSPRYIPFV
tara:strand:+ start:1339 stop:1971 length:633 start_codon:yes stop_codon:yes gene_type:complete